jgi:hypothetical protein
MGVSGMKTKAWLALALVGACLLGACSHKSPPAQEFVGVWTSSRTTTPINMYANGEWEIKSGDGHVMQYGVWQVVDDNIMWSYKNGGAILHDINPILSVGHDKFELRERDSTVTTFTRVAQDP